MTSNYPSVPLHFVYEGGSINVDKIRATEFRSQPSGGGRYTVVCRVFMVAGHPHIDLSEEDGNLLHQFIRAIAETAIPYS